MNKYLTKLFLVVSMLPQLVMAQTTMTIPCRENFDNLLTGPGESLSPGWSRVNDMYRGQPYVERIPSYASSSPNCLVLETDGSYIDGIITPKSPVPLNRLQVSFTLYKEDISYRHSVMIVAISDPRNYSSYVPIETVIPGNYVGHHNFTVSLENYSGNYMYIGIFTGGFKEWSYPYLDDIEIDYAATCSRVTNLQTQSNSPSSAISTWQPGGIGVPDYYIFSYTPATTINWLTDTTHNPYKILSGLNGGETYYISVTPVCSGNDTGSAVFDTVTTKACMTQSLIIGNGNTTSSEVPVKTDRKYSYTHQIYDSVDLGGPNTFSAIAFNYTGAVALTVKSKCTIYMANVPNDTLYGNIDSLVPYSQLTAVYSGPLNCVPGWNTFDLDTTFNYNGTDNLLVVVLDSSNNQVTGSSASLVNFATHATTGYKSAVIGAAFPIDPTVTGLGLPATTYAYRNNIKLFYCDTAATCAPPTVMPISVTDTSIQLAWAPGLNDTSWTLELSTRSSSGPWTYVTTTNKRNYNFTNLNASTRYYFRVGAICTNDTLYSTTSDSTDCAPITRFPYTESFENYTQSSARTSKIGLCWSRENTEDTSKSYPYVYGLASQGRQSVYYKTSSGKYALLTTPPIGGDVSKLMVTFDLNRYTQREDSKLAVGIMTDPTDIRTFVGIDTVWGSTTYQWETFTVAFNNYSGSGNYIAFVAVEYEATEMYLDNIIIDSIPKCPKPTDLFTSGLTSKSAYLTWNTGILGDGVTRQFLVEIKPAAQTSWTTVDTTSNNYYFFGGLTVGTSYDVRIRAVCTCGDTSDYARASFLTSQCLTGGDALITQGSNPTNYFPVCNIGSGNSKYSYTQQIYDNSEIGGPKNITAVEFCYASGTPLTAKDSCTIYLGHTKKSFFVSTVDYISINDLTPVYTGPINATYRWTQYVLDKPFYYNGADNLVIAIDDNSGADQSANFYSKNTVIKKSLYYYGTSDIDPSLPTKGSTGSNISEYRNGIKFISPCDNSVSCVPPNARILGKTSNSIDLIWRPGNNETRWVILYKPHIDSVWRIADTTTNTSYTLRNLAAMAKYDVRVMSMCGSDSAYVDLSTQTDCGQISILPYSEDFESYTPSTSYYTYDINNQLPECWDFYSSGSYSHANRDQYWPRIYGSSSDNYLPNKSGRALLIAASKYSSYLQTIGKNKYAVLPSFADSLPRLTVSFKYVMSQDNGTTKYGKLHFGYVVGNDTNFTTIASYPATKTAQTVFIDLSEDTNIHHVPGARLAFRCDAEYTSSTIIYFGIDDIEIGWAPPCVKPYDLGDISVDSTTSTIYWKDGTKVSTTQGYELVWGKYGFDPDTVIRNYATTTDTFYTFTNLRANSVYQVYVKALCGIDGNSKWSKPYTFRTAQIPATMPYNCNFENTSDPTNGWTFIGPTYGNNSWTVGNAVGNNSNRSLYISNTAGILNDYNNRMAVLSWAYRDVYVPVNNGNTFNLKFDWRADGESNYDYLAVYYGAISSVEANSQGVLNPPANSTLVGRYSGSGSSFTREVYQLPQLSDTIIRVYFAWVNNANSRGNNPPAAVDNVSVKLNCPEPTNIMVTNITQTSAKVTWRATTGSYYWYLDYRPDGINRWTTIPVNDTTYTLTGLASSMRYIVRARCQCTTIDTSEYSDSVRFSTVCGQIRSFPYTELFDSYGTSTSAYPTCWTYTGTASRPYCSSTTCSSAPASLYFNTNSNTQAIAVTPRMKVFNPYELEVSFSAYSTASTNILIVGLMSDSASVQSFIGVDTVRVSNANTWFTHKCDLSSYTGVGQFVGFKVGGSSASTFNIDNLIIDYHGADCSDPTNLATQFGTHEMRCTWNEVADYEFEYSKMGDTAWSTTQILNNVNNKFVSGLTDSTTYIWRIRTICPDSAGYSHWIYDTITTYALPCNKVTNVVESNITDTEITLKWDSDSNQNAWEIHCFDNESGVDTIYIVYTNPCRLTGLVTGLTYNFSIRSLCTSGLDGGWSDTIVATVALCKPVKNVRITPIAATAVKITWDITDPEQNLWEVEYGLRGFYEGDGTGTKAITATNSYTLTGLNMTTTYDVFVRARCNNSHYSIWTERNRFVLAGIDTPQDYDNDVFIYPNPATTEIMIVINANNSAGEYLIDVVDMKGRIVKSKTQKLDDNNSTVKLDVHDLAKGMYFVKITKGDYKVVRKLITQ